MNPDDALQNSLAGYFREVPVVCAYLFGSQARGASRPDSDVDIAVLFPVGTEVGLLGPLSSIRGDLERLLKRPVDIVDLRRAPGDLIHRVLRDGILLADHDPGQRVDFEVRARNEYFDLLPHLRRYRQGSPA